MSVVIREASADDCAALEAIIRSALDHRISAATIRDNLARLEAQHMPQLVAEVAGRVVGVAGLHRMDTLYRTRPVGRLTILAVADDVRGQGIGRMLVDRAATIARDWGCGMIEVTSNERWHEAHAFYCHIGWEQTSRRFCLTLTED